MKKRIIIALLASCLLGLALVLSSCGGGNTNTQTSTEEESNELTYKVKVVDYKGEPISSGLFVQLYKDGVELGSMKKANKDGEASFTLEKGEYTYELILTDDTLTYDKENAKLTAKHPTKEVMLYRELSDQKMVVAPYDAVLGERVEKEAYFITEGATLVPITGNDMNYYIFQPTRGGIYRFSYIAESAINIGYYGRADFILEYSIADVENRAFEVEIKNESVSQGQGGTTTMAIGIKSMAIDSCIFTIERVSDPKAETPRIDYAPTQVPKLPQAYDYLNATLVDLNVLDENLEVVYNSQDGYYHLGNEDGPVVLVRITTSSKYLASFFKICETANLYAQIKDEDGNVLRVEIYNQMINAYAEVCDDAGVVPLTRELEYAIKKMGEQQGWWGDNSIFKLGGETLEDGTVVEGTQIEINPETAWLFACCYLEKTNVGTEEQRIAITDTVEEKQYNLIIEKGTTLYLKSANQTAALLAIKTVSGVVVTYGGHEFTDGPLDDILIDATNGFEFEITYVGDDAQASVSFTFTTYIPE